MIFGMASVSAWTATTQQGPVDIVRLLHAWQLLRRPSGLGRAIRHHYSPLHPADTGLPIAHRTRSLRPSAQSTSRAYNADRWLLQASSGILFLCNQCVSLRQLRHVPMHTHIHLGKNRERTFGPKRSDVTSHSVDLWRLQSTAMQPMRYSIATAPLNQLVEDSSSMLYCAARKRHWQGRTEEESHRKGRPTLRRQGNRYSPIEATNCRSVCTLIFPS